jgi:hypothetical protein
VRRSKQTCTGHMARMQCRAARRHRRSQKCSTNTAEICRMLLRASLCVMAVAAAAAPLSNLPHAPLESLALRLHCVQLFGEADDAIFMIEPLLEER